MPAALPPSDPPNAKGICSYLWIAHRGDAGNGGERAEGDGDFENADADADAQGLTSTSTSSSSCSAFACLRHPFVRALADGSLPPSSFRFYVAQGERSVFWLHCGSLCAALARWLHSLTLFFLSSLSRFPLSFSLFAGLRLGRRRRSSSGRWCGSRDPRRAPGERRRGARAPPGVCCFLGRRPRRRFLFSFAASSLGRDDSVHEFPSRHRR